MPNLYDDYMTYVETLESPTIYQEWCCMSVVAACAQRKIWLDPVVGSMEAADSQAHYKVAPNLYIVLVGPPGIGKDTAMNVARNILADVRDIPTKSDSLTKEFIFKHMMGIVKDSHSADRQWTITHSSLTLFASEMSTLIKKNDRDFVGFLNYMFNTQPYANNSTKNKGEDTFPNPYLNILAGTTPDWVSFNVREDVLEGGFAARTVFVFADKKSKSNPFPSVNQAQKESRARVIYLLKQIAAATRELHMTNEGRTLYVEWYSKHFNQPPDDERLQGYFGRKPALVQKLSVIFALIRDHTTKYVDSIDIASAILLLNKTEPFIRQALSGVGRNPLHGFVTRILNQLKGAGGELPLALIQARNNHDLSTKELGEVITNLRNDGKVDYEVRTVDGKQTPYLKMVER